MKKILIALTALLILAACAKKDENKDALALIKERGVIKIGVFSDKPPFGFVDAKGENKGYDVLLGKQIAKELFNDEKKAQFVLVEAANRVEFLESMKVDLILANFTKTPERQEVVDFALPYMKVALGVVVPKNSDIKNIEDMQDKSLIVNKGTTADAYFTKNYPAMKKLKFDQNTETFAALKDGRGDALAHDNTLLFAWTKQNPDFTVIIDELGNKDVIAPAVKKGNKILLDKINEIMQKLYKEKFFHKAYELSLKPFFSDDISADSVVIDANS